MSEESGSKGKADYIDSHVGKRLKRRRILLGMSQQDLGDAVKVSIQQIQKYEKATNRIASGKLFSLAQLLQVPVTYFFDQDDEQTNLGFAEEQAAFETNESQASERELITLVRSFNDMKDINLRKKVLDLVRTLSIAK